MSCKTSFTTKTGTFTPYPEKVTKCEAEKLCEEKGQILAPFTNEADMRAAVDFFNGNNCHRSKNCQVLGECKYSSNQPKDYHVGLNFKKKADGVYEKYFSNGEKWDDKKHKSLYFVNPKQKRQCPVGVFFPYIQNFATGMMFAIGENSRKCRIQENVGYMCLDPAAKTTGDAIVEDQAKPATTKDAILFGGIFVAVLIAVGFAASTLFFQRKSKTLQDEVNQLKSGSFQGINDDQV